MGLLHGMYEGSIRVLLRYLLTGLYKAWRLESRSYLGVETEVGLDSRDFQIA